MQPINPRIQAALDQTCCMPRCLEDIIDKKVQGVALSIFEQIADFFCSLLWCGYSRLYEAKLQVIAEMPVITTVLGTPFEDRTQRRVVGTLRHEKMNYFDGKLESQCYLTINDMLVATDLLENSITKDSLDSQVTPVKVTVEDDADRGENYYLVTIARQRSFFEGEENRWYTRMFSVNGNDPKTAQDYIGGATYFFNNGTTPPQRYTPRRQHTPHISNQSPPYPVVLAQDLRGVD